MNLTLNLSIPGSTSTTDGNRNSLNHKDIGCIQFRIARCVKYFSSWRDDFACTWRGLENACLRSIFAPVASWKVGTDLQCLQPRQYTFSSEPVLEME